MRRTITRDTRNVTEQVELVNELISDALHGTARRLSVHERHLLERIRATLYAVLGDTGEDDE